MVHDIGKLVDFEDYDGQPPHLLYNSLFLIHYAIQVYFVVWISDAVIEEASKTGRILCRTASFRIDKPIKESVREISIVKMCQSFRVMFVVISDSDRNIFAAYSAG